MLGKTSWMCDRSVALLRIVLDIRLHGDAIRIEEFGI